MAQTLLFDSEDYGVAVSPEINEAIEANAPVALGVSGGKDSCAMAFAVDDHLNEVGHHGQRILIHADLGTVEWSDSLPTCQRLADALGHELVVVQRRAGGMMERWQGRWAANVKRYENLECVKLILPWSTPSMRFCTSELKVAPITSSLKKRFGGTTIINGIGIRAEESKGRAKRPISQVNNRLFRKSDQTNGFDWNPILHWKTEKVFRICEERGFLMHEAYRKYGSSRVSCSFCMLATLSDHRAAAAHEDNQDVYREMVDLEIRSTFSFQSDRWLGDARDDLLSSDQRLALEDAKLKAERRQYAESKIRKELCYVKGWPTFVPSEEACELIASVRHQVNQVCGLKCNYLTGSSVQERYRELIQMKETK